MLRVSLLFLTCLLASTFGASADTWLRATLPSKYLEQPDSAGNIIAAGSIEYQSQQLDPNADGFSNNFAGSRYFQPWRQRSVFFSSRQSIGY